MEGYGRFTPDVELCKISNCPDSCPLEYSVAKGAIYTVGELIYFSISALPMVSTVGSRTSFTYP